MIQASALSPPVLPGCNARPALAGAQEIGGVALAQPRPDFADRESCIREQPAGNLVLPGGAHLAEARAAFGELTTERARRHAQCRGELFEARLG